MRTPRKRPAAAPAPGSSALAAEIERLAVSIAEQAAETGDGALDFDQKLRAFKVLLAYHAMLSRVALPDDEGDGAAIGRYQAAIQAAEDETEE